MKAQQHNKEPGGTCLNMGILSKVNIERVRERERDRERDKRQIIIKTDREAERYTEREIYSDTKTETREKKIQR